MVVKELVALLGIKSDEKGQQKAEGGLNNLIGLAKAAVAAFAAIKAVKWLQGVIEEVATLGDFFDKLSARTGLATTKLQELGYAAQLSGGNINYIETAIKKLQQSQVEAADGVATYADEFKRMNIDVKNADGTLKDTTVLFTEMADGMQGLETDAERTAVAMRLLGRGGVQLIPMLKEGSAAIADMMAELSQLGGVIEEDMIQASADYVDNQLRMNMAMQGLKTAIAKEILPAVNRMIDGFIEWYKLNGAIIRQRMTEFFGKVGRVIIQNVKFWAGLVKTVGEFLANLSPMQKRILGITTAIIALGKLIAMGPLGKFIALAAAIALVIEDFQVWKEGGVSAIGMVMAKLYEFLGIDQAATYEQWAQDMRIFTEGAGNLFGGLVDGMFESMANFSKAIGALWDGDEKAWAETVEQQKRIWNEFLPKIADGAALLFGIELPRSWQELAIIWRDTIMSMRQWFDSTFIAPIRDSFAAMGRLVDTTLENIRMSFATWVLKIKNVMPNWLQNWLGGGLPSIPTTGVTPRPGAAGATSVVNAPNTSVQVDVKASPGMNEATLANEVGRQVSRAIEKQNQDTMRALTPLPAGPL